MSTLISAANIAKNAYLFINPTDSFNLVKTYKKTRTNQQQQNPLPTKTEVIEGLILGIMKSIAALSVCSLLYAIDTRFKRLDQKLLASVPLLCLYSPALFDYAFMQGFRTFYRGFHYNKKAFSEAKQVNAKAYELAQSEGHQITRNMDLSSVLPEARKRFKEISNELLNKSSFHADLKKSWQFFLCGTTMDAASVFAGFLFDMYYKTVSSDSKKSFFWVDHKLENTSNKLAAWFH